MNSKPSDFFSITEFITERSNHIPASVKGTPALSPEESLLVYRNDYQCRMKEVLQSQYPMTCKALGDTIADEFTESYVLEIPCPTWELSLYGHQFPEFINENLKSLLTFNKPFIFDLATLEWGMQLFFHEPQPPNPIPLSESPSEDWIQQLNPSPQLRVFKSLYNIPALFRWLKLNSKNPIALASSFEQNIPELNKASFYYLYKNKNQLVLIQDLTEAEHSLLTYWQKFKNLESTFEFIQTKLSSDSNLMPEELLQALPHLISKLHQNGFLIEGSAPQ